MFISKIKCFYYFPIGGHDQDTYLTFICIYKTGTWCLKSILAIIQWGSRQGYGSNCFIGQKKIVLLRNAVTHGFNAKLSQLMSNKDDKVNTGVVAPSPVLNRDNAPSKLSKKEVDGTKIYSNLFPSLSW